MIFQKYCDIKIIVIIIVKEESLCRSVFPTSGSGSIRPLPRLSLGTVYRNLQQMAREGRLAELDGPAARYDAVTRPHTHFRCRACGALMDLETVPYDETLDRSAAAQGYAVAGHSLVFTGCCPRCAGRQEPA